MLGFSNSSHNLGCPSDCKVFSGITVLVAPVSTSMGAYVNVNFIVRKHRICQHDIIMHHHVNKQV